MSRSLRINSDRQAGFGLVEVMIAVTLGLMVIAVVTGVFLSANRSYTEDDKFARMQENGRFAVKMLMDDLEMAGMWASLQTRATSSMTTCSGAVRFIAKDDSTSVPYDSPVVVLDSPTSTAVAGAYPCIDNYYDAAPNSDVLLVKRARGKKTTSPDSYRRPYLQINTNNTGSVRMLTNGDTIPGGAELWEYVAHLYYIRSYSVTPGDGIPTLCRKYVPGTSGSTVPDMVDEPLVEGIENFQIELGVDTPGDNGVADRYLTSPTPVQMRNAVNARIYVLARSLTKDPAYKSDKQYNLGQTPVPVKQDGYRRKVFSTNVSLRNVVNSAVAQRAADTR